MAIPYGRQHISEEDIQSVIEVLRSDYLTQGPTISTFESAFAEYIGVRFAVAVANGTAALHLAALSLGVRKGMKVLTTPITFAASANCILYCGGEVEFVDIDQDSLTIDLTLLEKQLDQRPNGTYEGIIPVDFAGLPVDMERLSKIAKKHDLWILEDSCHAPGGYFQDSLGDRHFCGDCSLAETAIFSFHPVKHIAAGEGGIITTNDERLYQKLIKLRTHGITKNPAELGMNSGGWYYEMKELGYNYRLSDIHAALAHSQLKSAVENMEKRRSIAKKYDEALADLPIILPTNSPGHAYHLYVIQTHRRKELYDFLQSKEIFCQVHYIPVHLMPYYRQFGWSKGDFPIAESYYEKCLSLPLYPSLSAIDQDFVISCIQDFYRE